MASSTRAFTIVIQSFTDLHEWPSTSSGNPCQAPARCYGGLSRRATLFNQILAETNGNVVFVDAGDLLAMGTTWETLQGDPEAWFTKRFNFSAFLPHSLDYMYGAGVVDVYKNKSGVPVIAPEIYRLGSGATAYEGYVIRTLPNGLRVALIGSVAPDLPTTNLYFKTAFGLHDSKTRVGVCIGRAVAAGADAIILVDNNSNDDPDFVASIPDLVHLHIRRQATAGVNPYHPIATFCNDDSCTNGATVFRFDAQFDLAQSKLRNTTSRLIRIDSATLQLDNTTEAYLAQKASLVAASNNVVVGSSDFTSQSQVGPQGGVFAPQNLTHSTGDIVADAYLRFGSDHFNCTVAFLNSYAIRNVFTPGPVTRGKINAIVPFSDPLAVMSLTGIDLLAYLQTMTTDAWILHNFPQVAGLRLQWNPNIADPSGNGRVTGAQHYDGQTWRDLEQTRLYRCITNTYLQAVVPAIQTGQKNVISNVGIEHDALAAHVSALGTLHAADYAVRRATISSSTTIMHLGCLPNQYLDASTGCKSCPTLADNSTSLWTLRVGSNVVSVPYGSASATVTFTITNFYTLPVTWNLLPLPASVSAVPDHGVLAPPKTSVDVTMTVDTQSRTLSQLNVYAQESTRTGIMTCYQQLSSPTIAMAYAKGFWRYEMSPGIFDAALASSALNLAILLPTLALIRFYSGSRMIRASAPIFLVIIVLGAILLTVSAVSFAILPSENFQSLCQLRLWLFVLGMVNVLAPLFVKTYRVAQIFTDASKGAVVKLPNSVLLRWVAIANLVLIVLMAGQIGIGELRSQFEVDMAPGIAAPTDDVVAQIGQCSSNTPFIILLVVIFACFTAWGATTAWKVRTAPSDFNESSQISIAILFIAAYATVMIPVQFLVGSNPVALVVIRSLGLNIGIFISSIVLFLPKVMIILQGRADEKPQTMMSGTQVTKFSTKAVTTLSTQA